MSACFTDVTSITACTGKFIYNARTEPIRERIFHVKQVLNFKGRENKFDVIGETSRHFATHVREHLSSDRSSHVNIYRVQSLVASHVQQIVSQF